MLNKKQFSTKRNNYLFLVGICLWLPGISLLNVGSNGFQPMYLLLLVGFVTLLKFNIYSRYSYAFIVYIFLSILSLLISVLIADSQRLYFVFIHNILMIEFVAFLYFFIKKYGITSFYSGYFLAGLFSSVVGIFQFLFPQFMPNVLNNITFSLSLPTLGRAFGFTPEPSTLVSLLLPLLGVIFYRRLLGIRPNNRFHRLIISRPSFIFFIVVFSMTASMSIIFALPIYFVSIIIIDSSLRKIFLTKKLGNYIKILKYTLYELMFLSPLIILGITKLQARLRSTDSAGSFAIRYGTIDYAFQDFLTSPVIGRGLGAANELIAKSAIYYNGVILNIQKNGVDSWFVRVLHEQGILGILPLVFLLFYAGIKVFRLKLHEDQIAIAEKRSAFIFCLGIFLTVSLAIGYRDLFNVWAAFAILIWLSSTNRRNDSTEEENSILETNK